MKVYVHATIRRRKPLRVVRMFVRNMVRNNAQLARVMENAKLRIIAQRRLRSNCAVIRNNTQKLRKICAIVAQYDAILAQFCQNPSESGLKLSKKVADRKFIKKSCFDIHSLRKMSKL